MPFSRGIFLTQGWKLCLPWLLLCRQNPAKPCLGIEPTWLGLKPSQNPWYLVSGPNEVQVLDVSSKKEFSERQSDREEVDLFRHREKCTPETECRLSQV